MPKIYIGSLQAFAEEARHAEHPVAASPWNFTWAKLKSIFNVESLSRLIGILNGHQARIESNHCRLMGGVMRQAIAGIIAGIFLVSSISAFADDRERLRRGHWEGREIHRFGDRDLYIWREGHWHHGRHDGTLGWWWIAAGVWYFYPRSVYPYPDPYTPPVLIINQQPAVVVPQPAPVPVEPQQATQLWYYCDSGKGYYPYVPNCAEGWRAVPAHPPAAPR